MEIKHECVVCGENLLGSHSHRRFCSSKCKARWRKQYGPKEPVTHHICRNCGTAFPIGPGQNNKWLCSAECRRAANAKSVREFHLRRPLAEAAYRNRAKEKRSPDTQNVRFYRVNPAAPRCCEGCGESRVTEIAHRPGFERLGERRTSANMKWPEMVWVLCPTCHRLLDRMGYAPDELGLC